MLLRSLIVVFLLLTGVEASAQGLFVFSGNGQIVLESFRSTAPMVVQARNAAGNPMAGIEVSWSITDGMGTIISPQTVTDAQGLAQAEFVATVVPFGSSWTNATITVSSAQGDADFILTTALVRGADGSFAAPPLAEVVEPPLGDPRLTGAAGSVLPGAVVVRVTSQAPPQLGRPVPNVGVRMVDANDPKAQVPVSCNGPAGMVLTDASGIAVCDLVLGTMPGEYRVSANVGELWITRSFRLEISPEVACSYTLTPSSTSIGNGGGAGTFSVTAASGCAWTALSSRSWIAVTGAAAGDGNGQVSFTVSPNDGEARSGTILVAGETFTVTQEAAPGSGSPLTITSAGLPEAQAGVFYSTTLTASGGLPPYQWSPAGPLPTGLLLNPVTGVLSGTPPLPGNANVSVRVSDSDGDSVTRDFTLVIRSSEEPPPDGFFITTTAFPSGNVGVEYLQPIATSGGCVSPFNPANLSTVAGALPPGLELGFSALRGTPTAVGTYSFTLEAEDACQVTARRSYSIQILGAGGGPAPLLNVMPTALAFQVRLGDPEPAGKILSVTASSAVGYTAMAVTGSGGDWLSVSPGTGTTPSAVEVRVRNFGALPSGNYSGTVTVTAAGAGAVSVPVTMTILGAPRLEASPVAMAFTIGPADDRTTQQALQVTSGGVPLAFTANVQVLAGGGWLRLTASSGTTPTALNVLVDATDLEPRRYEAAVLLTQNGDSVLVPVVLDVLPPPELLVSPLLVSFRFQQGVAPPGPRLITIDSNGGTLGYNLTPTTDDGGGWLFVEPDIGSTPQGVAITVNPVGLATGTFRGQLMVSSADGTAPSVAVTVELTIAPPMPIVTAVTSGASYLEGPVSPGQVLAVFGVDLGPAELVLAKVDESGGLPKQVAGTRVLFNGVAGVLLYTVEGQVGVIVPYAVSTLDRLELVVEYLGEQSDPVDLTVVAASPGIFTISVAGQGAIVNQDGSINGEGNGVAAGDIVSIFATGEGQTDPPGEDGKLAMEPLPQPLLPVSVEIDGQAAEVTYAGGAPSQTAGVLQVNARTPVGARSGPVTIVLRIGAFVSQPGVFVVIR